jgi:hypothetical protein
VVSAEAANLRAGPGTNYAIVGQAQQGDALQVIGRSPGGDWLLVVAPDGRRGWLSISLLKVNLVLDGVAVAELPPTPTPAVTPTPNPTPAPRVCPPGPALVQVISELDMQLTLKLQGPEEVIMIIPAGATQHYCLAPGEYSYAATAPSGETKAGAKAFVHEPGNCECWWWYATTSPLVMRAPIPGSCKCSPDPALYVSPPLAPGTHPAISPEKAAASCPTAGMCISYPEPGASIGGQVHVMGTANIEGFHHCKIEWWGEGGSGWNYLLERDQPVVNGELMMLDTRTVPAGRYGLRLTVVDQTGNYPEPFEIWWTVKH